ncbi:MAG: DUF4595 domain-containing protein [Niabella sp.]|nr:DUF4595 domain-containing protein [Niabella sp.]
MKNLWIVLLIAAMFGCKKEKVPAPEEKTPPSLITEMEYRYNNENPEVTKISYDAQGRISICIKGEKKDVFNYKTPVTLQVSRYRTSDNKPEHIVDCILNAAGAITKEQYRSVADNTIFYTYQYSYNAEGYLALVEGFSNSGTYKVEFQYSDGQLTQTKSYTDNVYRYTDHFKYDLSVSDKIKLPFWSHWPSSTLFGKPQQYALVEVKEFDAANKPVLHWTLSYQYDAATKILTNTWQSQLNNNVQQYRYKFY